jgi:ribosomal protein S18 acetylase RimI-like enzyme
MHVVVVGAASMMRRGRPTDVSALLDLMERLYAEDGSVPLHRDRHRRALEALLVSPTLGQIYVIDVDDTVVGYAVLTWGYSLERGGKHGLLDEMYVAPAQRGKGLARHLLAEVEAACRERGVRAVILEVERSNETAQHVYRRHGFTTHDRYVLTKWLDD